MFHPTSKGGVMYKVKTKDATQSLSLTRRRFVRGLAAGGALAALNWGARALFGEASHHAPNTLTGNHFDLTIDYLPVNFTGKHRLATAVNGSVPRPTLHCRQDEN